jgi:hypothetical protein
MARIVSKRMPSYSLIVLMAIVTVVSAITFLMWFRRAYKSLAQKASYLAFSHQQATYSWFIPFF